MTESADPAPSLVCPRCGTAFGPPGADRVACGGCGHGYGVLLGIPDLRIADGPYISNEGDWEKARRIAAEYDGSRFADLVALYYRLTPEVPARDAARFTQALLSAPERARGTVESWVSLGANVLPRGARFADVGCGTAAFRRRVVDRHSGSAGCHPEGRGRGSVSPVLMSGEARSAAGGGHSLLDWPVGGTRVATPSPSLAVLR